MGDLMDVKDIANMLNSKVDELVTYLLPAAVRDGHEWRIGSVAGEPGRSMAIHRSGSMRGVWKDFSSVEHSGDALDLVSWVRFGGNKKDAICWSKSWMGIDDMDPGRLKAIQAKVKKQAEDAERKALDDARRREKYAKAIWLGAKKDLAGTPVDLYLLGRGIGIADLAKPPGAIRFAPSLKYPDGQYYTAMVAAIVNGEGKQIAVHRTFLHSSQPFLWTKAPVPDAKKVLGSYRGGFIPLSRGSSNKSLRDAPDGETVVICEGIEDGLSIALVCPERRVLAGISVGNFQNIRLPQAVKKVILARDNDAAGSQADKALQNAVDVLAMQGRQVFIAASPEGKDFNDLLRVERGLTKKEERA